jgi:2-dehydropantoate 2-reductase
LRLAIVGIGGVGGYFGGKLALYGAQQADLDVVFVARGEHLRHIQEDGLQLITQEGQFNAIPTVATDNPKNLGTMDLVLFCVKGYDLASSAELLLGNVGKGSTVITLLNGVDNAERLNHFLPNVTVLNGCVYISAHIAKPGLVKQTGGPRLLMFGPEGRPVHKFKKTEALLRNANIKAELREDIQTVVWEKYIFVCPLASATTYLEKTFGEIRDDPSGRELLKGLMEETIHLARAMGVEFAEDILQDMLDKMSLFPPDTKSSMQLDFEKGRKTEIDAFTGYVVKQGKAFGIQTPIHNSIYEALSDRIGRGLAGGAK